MQETCTGETPTTRTRSRQWWRKKRTLWSTGIVLMMVGAVTAAIVIQQEASVNVASQATDVQFVDGGGGRAGYATVSIGTSGASATLTLTGVAGASMQVTDLLQIQNTDATQTYTVALSRSAAPNAAVEGLTFTVLASDDSVVKTFDAAAAASATAFSLPASTTYDIQVDMDVADGTAAGSLGSFTLQFSIAAA